MYQVRKGQVGKCKVGDVIPSLSPERARKLIEMGFVVDIGDGTAPAEVLSTEPTEPDEVPPVDSVGDPDPEPSKEVPIVETVGDPDPEPSKEVPIVETVGDPKPKTAGGKKKKKGVEG
jgi:hypothetical protein